MLHLDQSALWDSAWGIVHQVAPELSDIVWTPEFSFDAGIGRRHRFDRACVELMVAVEVDGGVLMPKGGRHGGDGDREKLNIAASLGWLVFRFSPAMLQRDPWQCVELVCDALRYKSTERK